MKIKPSIPPRKLNIIFDTTITITETEYIKMQHEIQSLKEQVLELQKYKTFFENFKNLLDKQ